MSAFPLFMTLVIWLALVGITAYLICAMVVGFVCGSILYSRLAFSLLAALVPHNQDIFIIQGGGLANYFAWVAIILAVLFAVSLFQRVGGSIRGLCTMVTSFIAIDGVLLLVGGILSFFLKNELTISTFYEIVIKLICAYFAFGASLPQEGELSIKIQSPILANVERLVSSVIHSFTILFFFMPMNENWVLSDFAQLLILVLGFVAAFVFDIFACKNNLFSEEE